MPQPSLADLTAAAANTDEPGFTPVSQIRLGGVDPLGLRQLNFDLMDKVFPALNNVARHIRPFVVVAWASRRAKQLAEAKGGNRIRADDMEDFVDRIEVIYAWSQFLRPEGADLPGSQFLGRLLDVDRFRFGGSQWAKVRKQRRDSTAFTAAINYGPSLKALGWVQPHPEHSRILIPADAAAPALDAFEKKIAGYLHHPAFSKFGSVDVARSEAETWSESWALEDATAAEKRVMKDMLLGSRAPIARRNGCALMIEATLCTSKTDAPDIRAAMAGLPSKFVPSDELRGTLTAWRLVQVRQLFRLSLEALFYWIFLEVGSGPKSSEALVELFMAQTTSRFSKDKGCDWLDATGVAGAGPTALMERIEEALGQAPSTDLAAAIADGIVFSLAETPPNGHDLGRGEDRLPLSRARRETDKWAQAPAKDFIRHILESWVLAQHVYWSIGRGLADARARGKTILRLKVILEEGGWTRAPGATHASAPVPTPDRLQTALSLAQEIGLLPGQ